MRKLKTPAKQIKPEVLLEAEIMVEMSLKG
jgi:hypothetical protein